MEIHNYDASSLSSPSPTFTAYSSENIGDIAARVIGELNLSISDDASFHDELYSHQNEEDVELDDDDETEFEFAVVVRHDDDSSADEIFDNGLIRPMFPIFNTELVYKNDAVPRDPERKTIRLPLRNLLTKDRESSESDDLEGIPSGTYCVWVPKKKDDEKHKLIGKKSNSTGSSSKRFRIRDLLYNNRSKSDGKETFLFLNPAGGDKGSKKKFLEGKKKSYLPYRQDLVGLFGNMNGTTRRTLRPSYS